MRDDGCAGRWQEDREEGAGGKDADNYSEDFGGPMGLEKVKGRVNLTVKVSNLKEWKMLPMSEIQNARKNGFCKKESWIVWT